MTPAGLLDTTPRRAARRRTVRTLAASQVFSGLGNGSALAVGSVMAVELSGHAGWGGTTTMAMSLAGALSAFSRSRRWRSAASSRRCAALGRSTTSPRPVTNRTAPRRRTCATPTVPSCPGRERTAEVGDAPL